MNPGQQRDGSGMSPLPVAGKYAKDAGVVPDKCREVFRLSGRNRHTNHGGDARHGIMDEIPTMKHCAVRSVSSLQ